MIQPARLVPQAHALVPEPTLASPRCAFNDQEAARAVVRHSHVEPRSIQRGLEKVRTADKRQPYVLTQVLAVHVFKVRYAMSFES